MAPLSTKAGNYETIEMFAECVAICDELISEINLKELSGLVLNPIKTFIYSVKLILASKSLFSKTDDLCFWINFEVNFTVNCSGNSAKFQIYLL